MASRKGYTSLPDAEVVGAEQPAGAASVSTEHSSVGARGEAASGQDAVSGSAAKKEASGAEKAGESAGKDAAADPTGGLPVAEGVFVGDPVTQSHYNPSGGGAYNPSAPQATVITSAPPAYQNHVVAAAAAAAAAAAGGDGRGIAMPHQESGQHTVIVMNGPPGSQFEEWGREPQPFVCRACGFSGFTATMTDPCSNMPILAAACCCLVGLWACSFVPFLIPELRDTVHRCPNCQITVGRSRRFR